jgi:arylsulfatase A-like enzyme
MSVHGYERATTPHLEAFARESLVFENAFAPSAWTVPGIVSLVTGYDPPVHGQNSRYGFYDKAMPTPLRLLAGEGYDVFGSDIKGPGHEDFGYQGKPAFKPPFLETFVEERATNPKPFFVWVHLSDLHLPYTPSEANARRWIDTSRSSEGVAAVKEHRIILRHPEEGLGYKHASNVAFVEEDRPVIRALYDGELADMDERLGKVLGRMRENGLLDRTIVVISADHGEELFEHGWIGHASTSYDGKLYDELIRIPLLIRLPNGSRAGRFKALVQGTDLMPTLLDVLALDATRISPPMQGQSLMPLVSGGRKSVRTHVFAQTTLKGWTTPKEDVRRRVVSVRSTDRKLIAIPQGDGRRIEAYDLRADPGETRNLYPSKARKFADLEAALAAWQDQSRETAARLVQEAAAKYKADLERALQDGDLLGAVRGWEAIEVMHQTWGLETDPFSEREPDATAWKTMRRQISAAIATAVDCGSRDKTFRFVPPAAAGASATVACPD